jgi:hypothetical protein
MNGFGRSAAIAFLLAAAGLGCSSKPGGAAALPFIEAQARKRLGVVIEVERVVSWDHTKLGGAY